VRHAGGPREGDDDVPITLDELEVAQFIYLLLNNKRLRKVIDTITSKVVLILGRFTPERKAILDALREELRRRDYLPVLFDFENPTRHLACKSNGSRNSGRNIETTLLCAARLAGDMAWV
jgi:hypothetical protein